MAAGLRFLGAERRAEAVDPAERHRVRFVVELTALRQVRGLVVEVLRRKQRGRALAGGRREDRRVGEDEAAVVEEVADGVDDLVPDAQDRLLPLAADPQVPAVEQEVDAVLLRRDRVVVRGADDLEPLDVDLVAARRALVGARGAGDDDRGFLRQVIGGLEQLLADRRLRHHRLDEAGAVADGEEMDLAARAAVVQPPLDGDLLAFVLADVFDVDVAHSVIVRSCSICSRVCARLRQRLLRRSVRDDLEHERAVVADLLHRHQRRPPSRSCRRRAAGDRRCGPGCRARASRSGAPTPFPSRRRRRRRGARGRSRGRCRRRRDRASTKCTIDPGARQLVRDHFDRDPHAERLRDPQQFLDAALRRRPRITGALAALRPRDAEVRDQHRHRHPPRDVQRRSVSLTACARASGSVLASDSDPPQRPPVKLSAVGAWMLRSSSPASASHCCRSATAAGLW